MLKNLFKFVVIVSISGGLAAASMAQAHAAITINGGGDNGLSTNGLGENGLGENGIGLNGGTENGGTENGVAAGLKGFAIEGIELPTAR